MIAPASLQGHERETSSNRPDEDGFVVAEVWRMESEGQPFVNEALHPLLAELGLPASEVTVLPVWSFARP